MNVTDQNEPFDPLTDTGKAIVAEAVRRIKVLFQEEARRQKEEDEMKRALLCDDLRRVMNEVQDEREQKQRDKWSRILAWLKSQI